jgi:hypothetical protein
MTKLRKSGVESAPPGFGLSEGMDGHHSGTFLTGLLLAHQKYLADGEAFSGKDF